jgi:capsid assembly protease
METTRGEVVASNYARVASLLFNTPLALTRDRGRQLATYLATRMRGMKPEAAITLTDLEQEPITVEMQPEGIALLSVRGTMTPKGSNVDALSGLVGYDALNATIGALATEDKVRGVVIAMDSPGGSVLGVDTAATTLAALAAVKPVYLVADHLCASAAYWIGSQATKLFVTETSLVGAIGSFMIRQDSTAADEKAGDAFTFVAQMGRKGDGSPHKALTDDEVASMEAIVGQSDALFFAAVTKRPGLSLKTIKQLDGDVVMGRAAIDAGLADEVGTVADAIAALRAALPTTTKTKPSARLAAQHTKEVTPMADATEAGTGTEAAPVVTPPVVAVAPPAAPVASSNVTPINKDDPAILAMIDTALKAKAEEQQDIAALCQIAGREDLLATFIASGKSEREVRAELQRLQAEQSEANPTSSHLRLGGKPATAVAPINAEAIYASRKTDHEAAYASNWGGGR